MKMLEISKHQAEQLLVFYAVHCPVRPFFQIHWTDFMFEAGRSWWLAVGGKEKCHRLILPQNSWAQPPNPAQAERRHHPPRSGRTKHRAKPPRFHGSDAEDNGTCFRVEFSSFCGITN